MTSKVHLAARNACLALVSTLCVDLAMGADVATDVSPQPVEELQELDDVWVHGERLAQRIEKAEDDFIALYNELNSTSRYDVRCGVMALQRGSMIMVRRCAPEFRLSYATYYAPDINYGRSACTSYVGGGWNSQFDSCLNAPGREVAAVRGATGNEQEYASNVLKVIQSDPRLQDMGTKLGTLYDELQLTRQRYVKLKPPEKSLKAKPRAHPRSL